MNKYTSSLGGKVFPTFFSFILIAIVLSPIVENWRRRPTDSFPLSHYPMFTAKRNETVTVTHIIGLDRDNKRKPVHYRYGGEGGMNQARKQIRKQASSSNTATVFCSEIARKVVERGQRSLASLVEIQIVTGEYALEEYFTGGRSPVEEKVNVSCRVEGRE